jgi:methionyl-tRNA formyltransferase
VAVADARVDWSAPPVPIGRLVRSVTPDPGAWTTFRDDRLGVGPLRAAPDAPDLKPGELQVDKRRVLVGTGGSALALGDVHAVGKRAMPATDWARGARIEPGELLR